jgi:hypothetical protein
MPASSESKSSLRWGISGTSSRRRRRFLEQAVGRLLDRVLAGRDDVRAALARELEREARRVRLGVRSITRSDTAVSELMRWPGSSYVPPVATRTTSMSIDFLKLFSTPSIVATGPVDHGEIAQIAQRLVRAVGRRRGGMLRARRGMLIQLAAVSTYNSYPRRLRFSSGRSTWMNSSLHGSARHGVHARRELGGDSVSQELDGAVGLHGSATECETFGAGSVSGRTVAKK